MIDGKMIGEEGAGAEAQKPQLLGFTPNPIFSFPIILPTNHFARSLLFVLSVPSVVSV